MIREAGAATIPTLRLIGFTDWKVVDACRPALRQTVRIKLPIGVFTRAKPFAGAVVPFVSKARGDLRTGPCPKLFNQLASQVLQPFSDQEPDNFLPVRSCLRAFSPIAIGRVRKQYAVRIPVSPPVLHGEQPLDSRFLTRRRKGVVKVQNVCTFDEGRELGRHWVESAVQARAGMVARSALARLRRENQPERWLRKSGLGQKISIKYGFTLPERLALRGRPVVTRLCLRETSRLLGSVAAGTLYDRQCVTGREGLPQRVVKLFIGTMPAGILHVWGF
jgi:hypothetical protein